MKEMPKRKSIRIDGCEYDYGAFFVTICTHNRQKLFGEIGLVGADPCVRPSLQGQMVEKWLLKLEGKFPNFKLDEYVIMPDHIHFVAFLAGGHMGPPLQTIIQWLKTQTTNEYIQNVKTGKYPLFNSKIWQRSYFDHVICNEQDLYETRKYIKENAARDYLESIRGT